MFFVDEETKERLPAHREVLKVASAVFFTMFDGDWKEKGEREIPATEDFSWESFKSAIDLLYGKEVEVEESSIPDMYRVAHCYDLTAVISSFAHSIQMWDLHQLSTVVDLCTLAGQGEAEEDQEENELIYAAVRYIAQHLKQIKEGAADITGLSFRTMLMLVQCENIVASEVDVLTTLNQWMDANRGVSMEQAQEVFSHIRYGTLPYDCLGLCRVGQSSLDMTLGNRKKLSIANLKTDLSQITPRTDQKEVLQVYPLVAGLTRTMQGKSHTFSDISESPAVAVVYSGSQEFTFEVALHYTVHRTSLVIGLYSVTDTKTERIAKFDLLQYRGYVKGVSTEFVPDIPYKCVVVTLTGGRCHLVFHSDRQPDDSTVSKAQGLPFSGPFPLLMTFGLDNLRDMYSLTFTHPVLSRTVIVEL